jgi:cytochrome c-type biogenesis protein CcmE
MNPKKRRRLAFAAALLVAGAGGAALVIAALRDNVLYFYSPTDVAAKHVAAGVDFRIGGLVKKGSVVKGPSAAVHFVVTDGRASVPVAYDGVLPDLFREGQGVVAMGALTETGVFNASQILAKHDEKYMPPEVVEALKRSGHWKEGQ